MRTGAQTVDGSFDNAHGPSEHHEHAYIGLEKQSPSVTHEPG